jgi:hypothetical protein
MVELVTLGDPDETIAPGASCSGGLQRELSLGLARAAFGSRRDDGRRIAVTLICATASGARQQSAAGWPDRPAAADRHSTIAPRVH